MISYHSTRGENLYTFSQAILKGIADDGGLFVPEKIPQITNIELKLLINNSYPELAEYIFNLFATDFSKSIIKKIVYQAYSSNFDSKEIAPLNYLKNNQYILELWHGPTSAFKDIALQSMPLFFSEAMKKSKTSLRYLILVATSGDTGKAALEGYKNKENISIVVFYPHGHVSQLQKLHMQTQEGNNVSVYALAGDFDTVQTLVKDIFRDTEYNKQLLEKGFVLSSANSINWGRLLPQVVYYVSSYLDLINKKRIALGEHIDVVVPSGNFGNLLAAFYAKKIGLPIRKFVCASNTNNVLTEFLQTGVYDISKRTLSKTPSPSMDILIASNIERLLHTITNDSKKVAGWMNELKTNKKFVVNDATKKVLHKEFFADWVSNEDCLKNIKKIFDETNYLIDPHTSVAQLVAERYIKQNNISTPVVICSTAHWAKFAKDVYVSLFPDKETPADDFAIIDAICSLDKNISAPDSLRKLKEKKQIYTEVLTADKEAIEKLIINNLATTKS